MGPDNNSNVKANNNNGNKKCEIAISLKAHPPPLPPLSIANKYSSRNIKIFYDLFQLLNKNGYASTNIDEHCIH